MTIPGAPHVTVHVAPVGDGHWDVDALVAGLDAGERIRALAFLRPIDRERYAIAHALRDRVMGRWRHDGDTIGPSTSLSHAGGLVAVAVAPAEIAIGIDVEPVDPRRSDRAVVARYLAHRDLLAFDGAPSGDRPRLFARAWTALEAEAKGRQVSLDALRGRPRTGYVHDIDVGPDHVLTLWAAVSPVIVHLDRRLLASVA